MAIPGNIRPGDLANEVNLARREGNIIGAKAAADFSLTKTQQVANPLLERSIATALPHAPKARYTICCEYFHNCSKK